DLWGSVGVSLGAVGSAETEVWIPVVASSEGVGSSVWRSDVGLLNRSNFANSVRMRLYRKDTFFDEEIELAPGEYRHIEDVMESFGKKGSGPLRVFSSEPLTTTSRTYNQAPTGTFGQHLDAVTSTGGIRQGESAVLMQLREDEIARTNIGILNQWRRDAEVEVALYDGSSLPIAYFTKTIPAQQTVQINRPFADIGGRTDIESGYAVISVLSGQDIYAYGSVVDNATDDPTTVPMKLDPGSYNQWIAAAAHATGENDSLWRTDLSLLNRSGAQATAEVRYRGDDGAARNTMIVLQTGTQRLLEDVVAQLGVAGGGSLQVFSDQPVLVSSRTYNASDEGTFGQFLDGVQSTHMAETGQTVWLSRLQQNEAYRTNVGLVNTGELDATVKVELFDAAGTRLASRRRTLAPYQRLQLQEPFSRIAGRDDLDAAYASVTVEAGEGIIAYASVIDNATNDPTTVPMAF
ncbi:MAG: hypothetical protein JRG86_14015, partial [Deltaproteobacteria bacterium]|nr:hypothetical protein [Deltaproteobacteria bacterium]